MEIVLSIAGSDPSAGAGIQQDLKTISAFGCYGATVITALTSQNTLGVQGVMAVPASVVGSQLDSVLSDLDVKAIKIGMIPNREVAEAIAIRLNTLSGIPIIYDPVMISTSGHQLMEPDAIDFIRQHLFPLCTLVTPNLPEAAMLAGSSIKKTEDIDKTARYLVEYYQRPFLLKGGHAESDIMKDCLYDVNGHISTYDSPRIETRNLHGTGCTLSSAIASAMAQGSSLQKAVSRAKAFITEAIRLGAPLHIGHGNGPLYCRFKGSR